MNAISNKISGPPTAPPVDAYGELAEAGHAFCGKFLHKCAIIENWAAALLMAIGHDVKKSYLFGHKLKAVRAFACADPTPLQAPRRVIELLDALQPLAQLRASLAHSIQSTAITGDGAGLVIFTPASADLVTWQRIVLDREAMHELVRDLSRIGDALTQQKLRSS